MRYKVVRLHIYNKSLLLLYYLSLYILPYVVSNISLLSFLNDHTASVPLPSRLPKGKKRRLIHELREQMVDC